VQELALSDDHLDDFAEWWIFNARAVRSRSHKTGYDEADCGNRPSMSVR
jgi:hypothetical protein